MNFYSDIHTVEAIQQTRYGPTSAVGHRHRVRHWLGSALGAPLVRAGAKLMDDPVALQVASCHLAVRAREQEHMLRVA